MSCMVNSAVKLGALKMVTFAALFKQIYKNTYGYVCERERERVCLSHRQQRTEAAHPNKVLNMNLSPFNVPADVWREVLLVK